MCIWTVLVEKNNQFISTDDKWSWHQVHFYTFLNPCHSLWKVPAESSQMHVNICSLTINGWQTQLTECFFVFNPEVLDAVQQFAHTCAKTPAFPVKCELLKILLKGQKHLRLNSFAILFGANSNEETLPRRMPWKFSIRANIFCRCRVRKHAPVTTASGAKRGGAKTCLCRVCVRLELSQKNIISLSLCGVLTCWRFIVEEDMSGAHKHHTNARSFDPGAV